MENDLGNYRKVYQKSELSEEGITDNPMELFQKWFFEVEEFGGDSEVNAVTVSTIGADGFPKARVVLLKKYTWEGFIFFTNYLSEKGKAIALNPNVCLSFFWPTLERQVIIKGMAEKIAPNLSDGYFESRPLGSQLGAIVSPQSQVIPNREYLEQLVATNLEKYKEGNVPLPSNWGGYIVHPTNMEFWQGRSSRLHDRIQYSLHADGHWVRVRLAP